MLHSYRSASMGSRRSVRFGGQAIHSLPFRSSNGPARDSCAATNGHHYSMTSSARPSSVIGTLRPSALAFREFRAHLPFIADPRPPLIGGTCRSLSWSVPVSRPHSASVPQHHLQMRRVLARLLL